jgi:transposase
MLLQREKARPHTSRKTREGIKNFHLTVLPHKPYSPDLAPSDFHLFGALKDAIRRTESKTAGHAIWAVKTWLREQDKAWYRQDMHINARAHTDTHTRIRRWCEAVDVDGDFVEI